MSLQSSWIFLGITIGMIAFNSPIARGDDFIVTARDLKSKPFDADTTIQLKVFKQITAADGTVTRGRQIGNTLTATAAIGKDVRFTFDIDVNNKILTNNENDPDRTILLVLTRKNVDTATIRFITVGSVAGTARNLLTPHQLNVAVPEPPTLAPCCYSDCSTERCRAARSRLCRR